MAGGLLALLDDVALIARSAAASADDVAALAGKTSLKAAGVVVDDAAVTPQYVAGVAPARELPMIWRIAKGSLINKIIIILPIALALFRWAPWALTPILMFGGAYLCYEGAHKVWHALKHQEAVAADAPVKEQGKSAEDSLVRSAITTDLILSAEIMVIALTAIVGENSEASLGLIAATLFVVGVGITAVVYGAVGLLVKLDDIGLRLIARGASIGHLFVKGMPKVLNVISVIGTAAMLWVGGHIIVVGLDELGIGQPYGLIHDLAHRIDQPAGAWLVETLGSLIVGLILGSLIVAAIGLLGKFRRQPAASHRTH